MAVLTAILAALPATLLALATLIAAMRTKEKVAEVHTAINSRMDELVEATRAAARAEGVQAAGGVEHAPELDEPPPVKP